MDLNDARKLSRSAHDAIRRKAVKAVVNGEMTQTKAAKVFGVSRTSVYLWVKRYREQGDVALASRSKGRPKGRSMTKKHEPVFAAALVRLLRACPDARKWPVLSAALADASPYVRAVAAEGLTEHREAHSIAALACAASDPVRLARVRAAEALAGVPTDTIEEKEREARDADPRNAAAAYNLGLALAELGQTAEAKSALADALALNPAFAEAAYNLGLLTLREDRTTGLRLLRQAAALEPENRKYAKAVTAYQGNVGE
jgi:tetratricopeptide (TPR) repeat protein